MNEYSRILVTCLALLNCVSHSAAQIERTDKSVVSRNISGRALGDTSECDLLCGSPPFADCQSILPQLVAPDPALEGRRWEFLDMAAESNFAGQLPSIKTPLLYSSTNGRCRIEIYMLNDYSRMRAPLTDLSDFPYIRETTEDLIATCVSNGIGGSANVGRFGHLQLDIYEGNAIEDESDWAAPELAWEPGQPDTVQPMSVDASAENSKSGCGVMACLRSATCCFGQQCTFNIVASTTLFKLAYGSDKTLREGRYGWCSTITEL